MAYWFGVAFEVLSFTSTPPLPSNVLFSALPLSYISLLRSCNFIGTFLSMPLPPFVVGKPIISRVPSLLKNYLDSSLIRTHPPSSHLQFTSCFAVIEPTWLQGLSPWDEEDFSSCLGCPYYHAVTNTPPKYSIVSASFRLNILPSPCERGLDLWILEGYEATLCSFALRPDNSLLSFR